MSQNKSKSIQRVEINAHETAIHCPFCGLRTYKPDTTSEMKVRKCEHLLFVAHDMGLEYRSERFDTQMGIVGVAGDDIELNDRGVDGFTDKVTISDAVKFAFYQGAPSFYGTYVGYAPID
jgi:hypothetical protein